MPRKPKKTVQPRYQVQLVLGSKDTGMYLPKNTGNWFSYRIYDGETEIGIVEIGRGSIFWKPYRNRRYGRSYRRSWEEFAAMIENC